MVQVGSQKHRKMLFKNLISCLDCSGICLNFPVEHSDFDYKEKIRFKKTIKMCKLCKTCEIREVETYVHFSSMYFLLLGIVTFHFAFFFKF